VKVLRQVFRGKLVAGLRAAFREGRLSFPGALQTLAPESACRAWLRSLHHQPWVVYAKPPFGSPAHVLHYLARYTHRVAISNHRLVAVTDETVSFRWKDYRHGSQIRTLTLEADEFLRLSPARAAEGLCPHPLLRLPGLALPHSRPGPLSPDPRRPVGALVGRDAHGVGTGAHLALPTLWWPDAHRRTTDRPAALRRGLTQRMLR